MCKFWKWCFWNFFPQKLPYFEEKHEEITNLLRKKFLNFKRWGNEYCCHAWRPWRQAKSCSTGGIDHPPTISILATDQAFDSLINISLPTKPRLWHWLWHWYLLSQPLCWWTQDKRFTLELQVAYTKVPEMDPGNSSFPFYFQYLLQHSFMN
jgi:hypothetical protein